MSALDEIILSKKYRQSYTPLESVLMVHKKRYPNDAESAAAELLALRERVAKLELNELEITALRGSVQEMKEDLAKCFMELYDSSFSFADDLAEKYFDSWNEIREVAKSQ